MSTTNISEHLPTEAYYEGYELISRRSGYYGGVGRIQSRYPGPCQRDLQTSGADAEKRLQLFLRAESGQTIMKSDWNHSYGGQKSIKYHDSEPGDICGLDGGAHRWKITSYCRGIGRGTCDCGAIRFFANVIDRHYIDLVKNYNKKYGKPGRLYKSPPRYISPEIKKEIKEMKPNLNELPPIPPKPDVSALDLFQARKELGKYYDAHEMEIINDYRNLGAAAAKKRWGLSSCKHLKLLKKYNFLHKSVPVHESKKTAEPLITATEKNRAEKLTQLSSPVFFKCSRCGAIFPSVKEIDDHFIICQPSKGQKIIPCWRWYFLFFPGFARAWLETMERISK